MKLYKKCHPEVNDAIFKHDNQIDLNIRISTGMSHSLHTCERSCTLYTGSGFPIRYINFKINFLTFTGARDRSAISVYQCVFAVINKRS